MWDCQALTTQTGPLCEGVPTNQCHPIHTTFRGWTNRYPKELWLFRTRSLSNPMGAPFPLNCNRYQTWWSLWMKYQSTTLDSKTKTKTNRDTRQASNTNSQQIPYKRNQANLAGLMSDKKAAKTTSKVNKNQATKQVINQTTCTRMTTAKWSCSINRSSRQSMYTVCNPIQFRCLLNRASL